MARKRKSRVPEAPQEPELAQPSEPEPEPVPEPAPEPEQPQPEEIPQTLEEDQEMGGEVVEEEEEEEERQGEGEGEGEGDEVEEQTDDAVATDLEKNEGEGKITEKSSENAAAENDQLTLLIKEAVSKHPDILENVHKLADADPAHCKIFVHGLGWEANAETITSVFGKYGEIEDCKVVRDKNSGKSKGYGFILFKHRDGARRALKQPQKMIEGRMTSCQLASAGPVQTPAPAAVATVSAPPVSEYTQRKIYVSNVSAELDPKKLLEFFSKFGEIEEGPLGLDKQTGKPRGFCLFVYKTLESAKKALEEPHKNFEGQILHCQKAIDGPKHSKGYFNQQHGQSQQAQQQQQHQHHHQGHQGYYHHPAKKGRYAGSSGVGHTGGHLMAPSAGPTVPSVGFNPAVAPAAIGQAVAALLATQGLAWGGYGGQPQMGQGGVRPHQGGAPYMGHGH
ncbi:UNVERIFIED_CONTAM: UBP1-associated protein 2A [Sesamum radiatum]|uniref:UBP1-associated protein 2A n=1 Tax=Sesamum radiatum TaxID=300843 RepID=A0AAW2W0Z9_SESRA